MNYLLLIILIIIVNSQGTASTNTSLTSDSTPEVITSVPNLSPVPLNQQFFNQRQNALKYFPTQRTFTEMPTLTSKLNATMNKQVNQNLSHQKTLISPQNNLSNSSDTNSSFVQEDPEYVRPYLDVIVDSQEQDRRNVVVGDDNVVVNDPKELSNIDLKDKTKGNPYAEKIIAQINSTAVLQLSTNEPKEKDNQYVQKSEQVKTEKTAQIQTAESKDGEKKNVQSSQATIEQVYDTSNSVVDMQKQPQETNETQRLTQNETNLSKQEREGPQQSIAQTPIKDQASQSNLVTPYNDPNSVSSNNSQTWNRLLLVCSLLLMLII